MRQFTRILSGGISIALLGVGLSACDPTEADPRLEPPLVRIATVQSAAPSERAFTGVISARIQSNLGFRVGGKIIERLVDTGQSEAWPAPYEARPCRSRSGDCSARHGC